MLMEIPDNKFERAIPYGMDSPQEGNYVPLWVGARFGGTLYITMHESSNSRIYFALLDIPCELPVVGHLDISPPEGMKVHEVMENILEAIDKAYIDHNVAALKTLQQHNLVRIQ